MPQEPLSLTAPEAQTPYAPPPMPAPVDTNAAQAEATHSAFTTAFPLTTPTAARTVVLTLQDRVQEDRLAKRAIARLRARSSVREAATQTVQGIACADIQPVLRALDKPFGRHWREAQVAAWTLGRAVLSPEQKTQAVEALIRLLQLPAPRSSFRSAPLTRWTLFATGVFAFVCSVLLFKKVSSYIQMKLMAARLGQNIL